MATSPMMQQYEDARRAHPDTMLLFRMGDFYEVFHEDARTAARVLGLTLTSRDKGDDPIPMAGFPHHQLESYLAKLLRSGIRAAICEQVEDPRQAKGLVKREVVRVVTPGTVTDDALLDPRENNYLAAVAAGKDEWGLAWVDLSTGRFQARSVPRDALADELARIGPVECLLSEDAQVNGEAAPDRLVVRRPPWAFGAGAAVEALAKHFQTHTLEGFGFDPEADAAAIGAAGAVLDYLAETQKAKLDHIDRLVPYRGGTTLEIDQATRRTLEITRTMREGQREGSLLWVLDQTVTPMGSRLLADFVANPLTDVAAIDERLDAVEELLGDAPLTEELRDKLRGVYDLERLLARITTGRASPRDLAFVGRTLKLLPGLKARLTARKSRLLEQLEGGLDLCADLRSSLESALVEDCPLTSREGGFIREGYSDKLDELRELASGGKQWIADYQSREVETSGIPSLKVGYNKVFGYYLEVTNAHRDKVPEHYIRKQTLKNAERYITPELKEYEEKVLQADEQSRELEYELFVALRETVAAAAQRLKRTAEVLAQLDVLASLAELARQRNYCRPRLAEEPVLEIREGRHPVLDVTEPAGTFVPNDTTADAESRVLLITGPNMAGKSTYIRQVALITLMAQMGGFVPAGRATIGVADRLFARVGSGDELARGQSTFMVEMTETARILNTATDRSLVILDEIGRGTSTYDGMSLAWSVVEYLHEEVGCRTLFATHYHELTELEAALSALKNLNVAVREWQDNVVFLHKIVEGAADKSYGIHVARLAGVPGAVVDRAKDILGELENQSDKPDTAGLARQPHRRSGAQLQLTLFGPSDHPLLDELGELNLDATTPLEALQLLQRWQERLQADRKRGG